MTDCDCTLTNDSGMRIHSYDCPDIPMPSRTLDGFEITDGMRVWDYDLRPGTVRLADRRHDYHSGDVWFDVVPDGSTRGKSFNGTRTWKLHPTTRKPA